MKSLLYCGLLGLLIGQIVAPPARHSKEPKEEQVDRMPEPEFWHYLKKVGTALKGYKKELENVFDEMKKKWGKDFGQSKKALKDLTDFFNESISPSVKKELNKVKKAEMYRLRRKFLVRKKNVEYKEDLTGHDHVDKKDEETFGAADIFALYNANTEHYDKYEKMRKEDFKRYEMEKKFLTQQKARHIKDEQKRKEFLEQEEKEKAEYAAAKKKEKAPLTKEEIKQVWTEKDELPEEEFNSKTFFALHDVDSDGVLDMDEIRMLVAYEVDKTFNGTKVDKREKLEEMEKMRKYIYKKLDKNNDLMIDYEEFMEQVNNEKDYEHDDDWKDNEDKDDEDYDDEEFDKFEKEKIDEIREDFAEGIKPEGYDFADVPLLDGNFINETHFKVGNETFEANDAPRDERNEAFKKYEMEKKFEKEHEIQDMDKLSFAEKDKLKNDLDSKYYNPTTDDNYLEEMVKPLSPEQLETVWEEQDHKTKKDFNLTKFFHLHDVNQDSFIDKMELRMMLISVLQKDKGLDQVEKTEELENMEEEVMEFADENKDGKISIEEFYKAADKRETQSKRTKDNKDARKLENKEYWEKLHKETKFTAKEYIEFSEKRTLEIRKLIANGIIAEKYNYTHVPLLQGNFINTTHIQRGEDLIEIHEQNDEQRKADFKKFKMAKRFEIEQTMSKMTPDERALEKERLKKEYDEFVKKLKSLNEPLSEKQVKEVWEEEDKMEKEDFSDEKFFRIHDVNEDGRLDKQEVRQILLKELAKVFNKKDKNIQFTREEKVEKLEKWTDKVYKNYDSNKDGDISLTEFLDSVNGPDHENKEEEEPEYTDEEYEKYKAKTHK